MNTPTFTVRPAAVALMALMAATRFNHFGTPFALPDATLAIFFFAGLWLGGRYLFALLLIEAGLIDYAAIHQLGVSDFCISPAYGFLTLSYLALWLAGQNCRKYQHWSLTTGVQRLMALTVSTSIAFLISNGSFFLLSDKVQDHSWTHYLQGVASYYPAYLTTTLSYGIVIFGLAALVNSLLGGRLQREAA